MLCRNSMTRSAPFVLTDPLSLSAGTLPRLGWAAAVLALVWGGVFWAMAS